MTPPAWLERIFRRKAAAAEPSEPSLTGCPKCGAEMVRIDKSTMSGYDMRTYRCDHCQEEHIVNFGIALWKVLSDAREAGND